MTISPAFLAGTVTAKAPPVPGDANWASVVSLLPLDGANDATVFTDIKGHTWTVRGANVKLSTAQKKWGTASLLLPGADNGIRSSTVPVIGTNQFAVQGWFRSTSTSANYQVIVGNYNASAGDWTLILTNNGRMEFYESTGNTDLYSTTGVDLRDSAWHYYSLTRDASNRVSMAVDGTEVAFATGVTSNMNYTGELGVGYNNFLDGFVGNLDDMRLTIGASRAHTVPTRAFPTIG